MHVLKTLESGAVSRHNFYIGDGKSWPLPQGKTAGAWVKPVAGELRPHYWGYHASPIEHFVLWFAAENYIAETGGDIARAGDCLVARSLRLVQKVDLRAQDWGDMAIAWSARVTPIPDLLGYPFEYGRALGDSHDFLAQSWKRNGTAVCGGRVHRAIEHARLAVNRLIERCAKDRHNTLEYRDHCEAVLHAGRAIAALYDLQFGAMPRPAHDIAKAIAYDVAVAYDHAARSHCKAPAVYARLPDGACNGGPVKALRAEQNALLVARAQLRMPGLSAYFPSLNR